MVMRKFPCYRLVFLVKCRIPFSPFIWPPPLTFQTLLLQSCFSLWSFFWHLEDITMSFKAAVTIRWRGQGAPLAENVVFKVWIGAEAATPSLRHNNFTPSLYLTKSLKLSSSQKDPFFRALIKGRLFIFKKDLKPSVSSTMWISHICLLSATPSK